MKTEESLINVNQFISMVKHADGMEDIPAEMQSVERLIKLFKNSTNKPKIERKLPAAERNDEHKAFKNCSAALERAAPFKTDRKFEGFSKVLVNSSYLLP